jgi:hypothetical protein
MEREELEQHVIELAKSLRGFAFSLTGNWWVAEDLVSETWVRALKHADRLRASDQVGVNAWLRFTLRNILRDWQRRRGLEMCRLVPLDGPEPVAPGDPANRLEEVEEARYLLDQIRLVARDRLGDVFGVVSKKVLDRQGSLTPSIYDELANKLCIQRVSFENQLMNLKKLARMVMIRSEGGMWLDRYATEFSRHAHPRLAWMMVDMSAMATHFQNWRDDHPCGRLIANPGKGMRVFVQDWSRLSLETLERCLSVLGTHVQRGVHVGIVDVQSVPDDSRLDIGYFGDMAFDFGRFYPLGPADDCVRYKLADRSSEPAFVRETQDKVHEVRDLAEPVLTRLGEVEEYIRYLRQHAGRRRIQSQPRRTADGSLP